MTRLAAAAAAVSVRGRAVSERNLIPRVRGEKVLMIIQFPGDHARKVVFEFISLRLQRVCPRRSTSSKMCISQSFVIMTVAATLKILFFSGAFNDECVLGAVAGTARLRGGIGMFLCTIPGNRGKRRTNWPISICKLTRWAPSAWVRRSASAALALAQFCDQKRKFAIPPLLTAVL